MQRHHKRIPECCLRVVVLPLLTSILQQLWIVFFVMYQYNHYEQIKIKYNPKNYLQPRHVNNASQGSIPPTYLVFSIITLNRMNVNVSQNFVNLSYTDLYKCYSVGPCTVGNCDISLYVLPESSAACSCAHNMHTYGVFRLSVQNVKKNVLS